MGAGLSRRTFLVCAGSLAGVGWWGVMAPGAAAAPALVTTKDLAFRRSAFLPLLGQTFRIVHNRRSLTVVLHQVSDLQPCVRPGAEDQFSLIFTHRGLRPALSQGTYPVRHARRGQISLFLVPIGRSETAQHYQAIIDSRPRLVS